VDHYANAIRAESGLCWRMIEQVYSHLNAKDSYEALLRAMTPGSEVASR